MFDFGFGRGIPTNGLHVSVRNNLPLYPFKKTPQLAGYQTLHFQSNDEY